MHKKPDSTFTSNLTEWYIREKRDLPWRKDKEPYHVWISEIMLQQTRVEAVRDYYTRFIQALPTIQNLAEAEEQTLLKLWQGLGYYNRVRNMQKAAKTVQNDLNGEFPRTYEEIKKLSGIGEYTAGAIASICFDERVPAVDGNVLRVMTRILENDGDIKSAKVKRQIGEILQNLYPSHNCGNFTQGLIELGALICVPKGEPKCELCPVSEYCGAKYSGTVNLYPFKSKNKERRKIRKTVFILRAGKKIAVRRRPENVLLAGLYEFPNVDEELTIEEAALKIETFGLRTVNIERVSECKHIFSHAQWEMKGMYFTVENENKEFQWVDEDELEKEIPLPSAFQYFV